MSSALVPASAPSLNLADAGSFAHIQRVATMFSESQLVPTAFQRNLPNCVIALEMAARMGASPMAVMQNLYIIHGKPSFSSTFIIAAINASGRFLPLRFDVTGKGDDMVCVAWTLEKDVKIPEGVRTLEAARTASLPVLESAPVSIQMAIAEGWVSKAGSKWKTMPELMIRYRAATFFGRMYAPDIIMGMKSEDEVTDIDAIKQALPEHEEGAGESGKTTRRKPRGGVLAAAAETTVLEATTVPPAGQPPAEEKPAEKPAETPASTEPAPTDIPKPDIQTKRCEIKAITPKKSTAGPTLEVILSGEYEGKAYIVGSKEQSVDQLVATLPSIGAVADVVLEKKKNGEATYYFINGATVLA
jgi:hypothetical protein